jgi:hypothetical protein
LPSQFAASVAVLVAQLGVRHCCVVNAYVHVARLLPSHEPPHRVPVPAQAGRVPRGAPVTATHLPGIAASPQASHDPPQVLSQHTPSTQNPDAQSVAARQGSPSSNFVAGPSPLLPASVPPASVLPTPPVPPVAASVAPASLPTEPPPWPPAPPLPAQALFVGVTISRAPADASIVRV